MRLPEKKEIAGDTFLRAEPVQLNVETSETCKANKQRIFRLPNGLAQRQRRDRRDSFSIMHHFWQADAVLSGGAAVRLELVLGGLLA